MKEKLKKAKGYVKEHKKEILIGTGVAILGCIGLSKVVKTVKPKCVTNVANTIELTSTKIDCTGVIGDVFDAMKFDGGCHELWIDGLSLDELGELGESIKKSVPDIPKACGVQVIMDIYNKD